MDNIAVRIDERLKLSASADQFSGAVLVNVNGASILAEGYGDAIRESHIPNRPETQFRLGSLNKMFTGTAALQLVQNGNLDLSAPIGEVLPNYPNREVARDVTLHHLLTHTSGLGDIWGAEFDAHRGELRSCSDYVALYGTKPSTFTPGSQFLYSSYGFILVGRLIEAVSGLNYYEYVQNHIFDVAGMGMSGSLPEEVGLQGVATGYMRTPDGWCSNTATLPFRGTPAGGGYSTVADLNRFAIGLVGHRFLDADHTRIATTGKSDIAPGRRYGYGFMEDFEHGLTAIGHVGSARGMATVFRIYPEKNWTIIVLSNRDAPAANIVANSILEHLLSA